jgi:hypothetical protein
VPSARQRVAAGATALVSALASRTDAYAWFARAG